MAAPPHHHHGAAAPAPAGIQNLVPPLNSVGGITLAAAPSGASLNKAFIEPTPFAPVYRSIHISHPEHAKTLQPLLAHVNCGYLSKKGHAPTLLQLKQHAQALTILIKSLTISTRAAIIDNTNSGIAGANPFNDGETYDFLNDLTKVYSGPSNPALAASHNRPLTSVLNVLSQDIQPGYKLALADGEVRYMPDTAAIDDICPLHYAEDTPVDGPAMPYATHEALIAHANEILEMLDHEYSAKGGLLSILPPKEETDSREKAEATLLGQLILYVQRLVQRLHDLERLYANSMDALAGEAVVPHQALSQLGPDGRKGREVVYPQDRFVLVNAGDDVWQFLNREFEYKEQIDERVAENYKRNGVTGEALWATRGGREMVRGITAIDITTRYYRLRDDSLKTIFVIPAHGDHPATKATRDMEQQPTVVAVVKPVWPERVSEWEMKHRAQLKDLKDTKLMFERNFEELQTRQREVKFLTEDNKVQSARVRLLQKSLKACEDRHNQDPDQVRMDYSTRDQTLEGEKSALLEKAKAVDEKKKQDDTERLLIQQQRRQLTTDQAAWAAQMTALRKTNDDLTAKRVKELADMDSDLATTTIDLHKRLEAAWRVQLQQTQELNAALKRKGLAIDNDSALILETGEHAALSQKEVDEILKNANALTAEAAAKRAAARHARDVKKALDDAEKKAADDAARGDTTMGGT